MTGLAMTVVDALDVIDGLIHDTAARVNAAAIAVPGLEAIGGCIGPGIRMQALTEAKDAIVKAGIKAHAAAQDFTTADPLPAGGERPADPSSRPGSGHDAFPLACRGRETSEQATRGDA